MSRLTLNLILMAVLVLLSAVSLLTRADRGRPNFELFPNMVHSVASDSFAANSVFEDGKTLRRPVAGTIPLGYRPLRYGPSEEEAIRAGEELINPLDPEDKRAIRLGADLYQSFCSHCHGGGGNGDGEVGLHGFPAPPSLLADQAKSLPDGRIFHIITFGQKNMPPHAIQIDQEDRWRIILHVRSLQQKSEEPATPLTAAAEETPEP